MAGSPIESKADDYCRAYCGDPNIRVELQEAAGRMNREKACKTALNRLRLLLANLSAPRQHWLQIVAMAKSASE